MAATAGACAAAELFLRLLFPQPTGPAQFAWSDELGVVAVPGQKGTRRIPGVYDYRYSNNSLGLRGPREITPPAPGVGRILFLGDSFAYGIGVNDDQTFSALTETELRRTGRAVEVVNGGLPDKGTGFALHVLRKYGSVVQPTVVAMFLFVNDLGDDARREYFAPGPDGTPVSVFPTPGLLAKKRRLGRLRRIPLLDTATAHSHLASLAKRALLRQWRLKPDWQFFAYGAPFEQDLLASLQTSARSLGAEVVFFLVPERGQVESKRTGGPDPMEGFVSETAEKLGVRFVPLSRALAASGRSLPELFFVEGHLTPEGHRIVANEAVKALEPLLEKKAPEAA